MIDEASFYWLIHRLLEVDRLRMDLDSLDESIAGFLEGLPDELRELTRAYMCEKPSKKVAYEFQLLAIRLAEKILIEFQTPIDKMLTIRNLEAKRNYYEKKLRRLKV